MIFRQLHLEALGHASYLIGDNATGQALVLDPRPDVDIYLDATRAEGLRITHALDTHGHNDYLSGLSELAARTDTTVLGSAAGDLGYEHQPVRDGEVIELGDVAFEVPHTPGHTPEHVSLLPLIGVRQPHHRPPQPRRRGQRPRRHERLDSRRPSDRQLNRPTPIPTQEPPT